MTSDDRDRREVLSVLVVSEEAEFAESLEETLPSASEGRIAVVATAATLDEALDALQELTPDVALVDLSLSSPGACALFQRAQDDGSRTRMIGVIDDDDSSLAAEALGLGVQALVTKSAKPEHLMAPVLAVLQGWRVVTGPIIDELVSQARRPGSEILEDIDDDMLQLWLLVAEGLDLSAIADRLHVSERTAKRMVAGLRDRLGVGSRMEMAGMAGRVGLLDQYQANGSGPKVRAAATGTSRRS